MTGKRKQIGPYSAGELNKAIDAAIHPLAKKNPWMWALDTLLHGCVEQNPAETAINFFRYTFPKISKEISKELERVGREG